MRRWIAKGDLVVRISAPVLALVLAIVFFVAANLLWSTRNTVPPTQDLSNYMETTELLYQAVRAHDPRAFREAYVGAVWGHKPPLISLLPLPAYLLSGNATVAFNVTLAAMVALFLWAGYRMCVSLTGDRWLAVVAVVITATMPLVYGVSRLFYVDYGLMILVTLWMWLQVSSKNFRTPKFNIALGIVFGLGMLAKVSFPFFIAVPVAYGFVNRLREESLSVGLVRRVAQAWLVILCVGGLLLGTWYVPNSNYKATLGRAFASVSAEQDNAYGAVGSLVTVLKYGRDTLIEGLSVYYALLFVVLLASYACQRLWWTSRVGKREGEGAPGATVLLIVWPSILFAVSCANVVKDLRYLLPMYPAIGAGLACLLFGTFRTTRGRAMAAPVLLLMPLTIFSLNSLPLSDRVAWSPGGWKVFGPSIAFVYRPIDQRWPDEAIVQAIARDAQDYFGEEKGKIFVLLLADTYFINQHTFRYYVTHLGLSSKIDLSAIQTSKQDSEARLREILEWMLQGKYIVDKTGSQGPDVVTHRNKEIRDMLDNGAMPYTRWAVFDLPDGSQAVVYRQQRGNVSVVDLSSAVQRRGVVVKWEVELQRPDKLRLKVWREHASGFVVVGESETVSGRTGRNVFTLEPPLSVWSGDFIGLYSASGNVLFKSTTDGNAFRRQYEFLGDVACGTAAVPWVETRPYRLRVYLAGADGPRERAPSLAHFEGKPSPLTFVDMSKRIAGTGTIVAWAVNAAAPEDMRLKIWRRIDQKWTTVAESPVVIPVVGLNRFAVNPPLKVEEGDYVGFYANWHGPDSKGVSVPFPIREGGCPTEAKGSFYVPGDFRGTVTGTMTPDKGNFQIYAFQGQD